MNDTPLLRIEDLSVQYMTDEDVVHAVNGLNVELYKGESLGFVGETGAGKTTAALSVIQLLPEPAGVITGGSIWYNGRNLIENKEKENVEMRGDGISMIFQDPMTALNPTLRISRQMMEVVESHRKVSRREAETICIDMLEKVGIKRDRFDDYPHQLSGGMKQRVVIAMALLCNPEILIADSQCRPAWMPDPRSGSRAAGLPARLPSGPGPGWCSPPCQRPEPSVPAGPDPQPAG